MNFQEIVNEVVSETKRPDLLTSIKSAVRASTLKAHTFAFFYRDIIETGVEFNPKGRVVGFAPKEIFPRYRAPKNIILWLQDEWDPIGKPGPALDKITIGQIKDYYGFDKTNVYYQAGNRLNLRARVEIWRVLFSFYQYPDTSEESYSSWIADEYPWAIIYDAARKIFTDIGFIEQANRLEGLTTEQYAILTTNNTTAEFEL